MSTYGHLFIHAWAKQIIIGLFFVALFINMKKPNVPNRGLGKLWYIIQCILGQPTLPLKKINEEVFLMYVE